MSITQEEFNEIIDLLGQATYEYEDAKELYSAAGFASDSKAKAIDIASIRTNQSPQYREQPSYLAYIARLNQLYFPTASWWYRWFGSLPPAYDKILRRYGDDTMSYIVNDKPVHSRITCFFNIAPVMKQLNQDFKVNPPYTYTGKYKHKIFSDQSADEYYVLVAEIDAQYYALNSSQPLNAPKSLAIGAQRPASANQLSIPQRSGTANLSQTINNNFLIDVMSHPASRTLSAIIMMAGLAAAAISLGVVTHDIGYAALARTAARALNTSPLGLGLSGAVVACVGTIGVIGIKNILSLGNNKTGFFGNNTNDSSEQDLPNNRKYMGFSNASGTIH